MSGSIRRRLFLALILLGLIPILALEDYLGRNYANALIAQQISNVSEVADKKEGQIRDYIDEKFNDIQLLAMGKGLGPQFEALENAWRKGGPTSSLYKEAYEITIPLYRRVMEIGDYGDIYFIALTGEVIFSVKREADFGTNLFTGPFADSPLADAARSAYNLLEPDISPIRPYGPSGGSPAAFMATPIIADNRLIGILAAAINADTLIQTLTDDTGLGESGETMVVEQTGRGAVVVMPLKYAADAPFHMTFSDRNGFSEPMKKALAGARGAGRSIDYRNVPVIAAWRYIPPLRVGMVVKIDENEALKDIQQLAFARNAVPVGVIVSLFLLLGYLSRQIVRPLALLEETAVRLSEGDLSQRAPVSRNDEVGRVAVAFNLMAARLQSSRETLEATVAERTAALQEESERSKRLAAEIAETAALRQAIVEGAGVAIIATDIEGVIRSFNPGAERLIGYSAEEVVGRATPALFHDPAEVAARAAALTQELGRPVKAGFEAFVAKATPGHPDENEWTYLRKTVGRVTVRLAVTALADPQGTVNGYLGIATDISRQKADERALRQSEEALALAQRIASMGSWDWNIRTGALDWSDEIYRVFGLLPQQFGATYEAFLAAIHPDDRERVANAVNAAVEGVAPYDVEHRVVRPDGEIRYVHEEGEVTRDDNNAPVRMLGTVHDITDVKVAEERIRLAAKVFESAGEAIVITDADTRIVEVNPAYLSITGFAREEIIGKRPSLGASGHHDNTFYDDMWRQINETGRWSGEIWDRRKEGEVYPTLLTISAITDDYGVVTHYAGVFTDISYQKATEENLERLAYYDPLTSLPNRALFRDRLAQALELGRRHHTKVALFFIDLDRFKHVNDSLGHSVGDELLRAVALRITGILRASDTLARLGGDEFTVILGEVDHPEVAGDIAQNIIDQLHQSFHIEGNEIHIGGSIGIGIFPDDGDTDDELIKNADVAMYQAKDAGRGVFAFYEEEMNQANRLRRELEQGMRRGIDAGEFVLYYQPKVCIETGDLVGAEALIRWNHPERGLLFPDTFIPVAEESGLILPLGEWVIREACRQMAAWGAKGVLLPSVAVNLSARQFGQATLADIVREALSFHHVAPERLELEITESALMVDPDAAIQAVKKIKGAGVRFSLDDFGTGYSSLSYLKRLPIDALKIDKSFVLDLINDKDDRAIVASVIALGDAMGLRVIAEGVESAEHVAALKELGAGYGQGYYWSKPIPPDPFETMISRWRTR